MCLFRSVFWPNRLLHLGQRYFLIFWCTHSICLLKYCFVLNRWLHICQTWSFNFLCTWSMCRFKLISKENCLEQKLHWWGLSFSWTAIMWSLRVRGRPKLLSQMWHLNLFCFSWTAEMWRFKLLMLHKFGLIRVFDCSPLFWLKWFNSFLKWLICSFFLWKYFIWIIRPGRLRNFRLHLWQLCNFCSSNDDRFWFNKN